MKKTLVYTAIPKILVLLSTGYATLMMLHWSIGFTFFTQLSNWYCAAAVGCQLLILWKNRAKNLALQDSPPAAYHRFLYILKILGPCFHSFNLPGLSVFSGAQSIRTPL